MKNDFVPFSAGLPSGQPTKSGSSTQVMANAQATIPFHPLSRVSAQPNAPSHSHAEPTVTFERDGDRITRIRIACSCGNIVELDCDYSEKLLPPAPPAAANGAKRDP